MPRLMLYNICYGQGYTGSIIDYLKVWKPLYARKRTKQIAKLVSHYKPDIAALIEVDLGSIRSTDQLKVISQTAELPHTFGRIKYAKHGLSKVLQYVPILRRQANGIASKLPFKHTLTHMFSRGMKRLVMHAVIDAPKPYTIIVVHLALAKKARELQITELARLVKTLTGPVIVCGDFNVKRQDEVLKFLNDTGLLITHSKNNHGTGATFPTNKPRRCIDLVFTTSSVTVEYAHTVESTLSDHSAVVVDFNIV